jgi:2-polyprenyl-3-methyl-5-hydroxy-6-metoxy-1,4-benzoquinol methylase
MPTRRYYESLWKATPTGLQPADFRARLTFLLGQVSAGARVLDVGCGEGRFAAALTDAGAQVVAIDVADEPLRRARVRCNDLDLRLAEPEGPWLLKDASFDVVWAGETIEHVADTAAWLSEVRRVLRPGGRLLVSTPAHDRLTLLRLALSRRAFAARFEPRLDHLRFYSRATLTELLEDFGFERIEVRGIGGAPGARRTLLVCAQRMRF